MRQNLSLVLAVASLALLFAPVCDAQLCPNSTDTFWKNDTLPQVPGSGALAVSVIQGLCENEAAAQVFYLPTGMGQQQVTKVAAGFGDAPFGVGGFTAISNIEVYDGCTWNGQLPVLGAKVLDLELNYNQSLQLYSHGINELDISTLNVVVGNHASKAFVVAFRIGFNPNGTCATGYTANFFTDYGGTNPGICHTIPQTSLIDIQGQGWRDASIAKVAGFSLCPLFFNGNWVIRACTANAGPPPVCQADLGFSGPGNLDIQVCGQPLASGNSADFLVTNATASSTVYLFVSTSFLPTYAPVFFGVICPLPVLFTVALPTDGNGALTLAGAVPGGLGPFSFYLQAVGFDPPQPMGYEVSNCVRVDLLP